MKIRFQKLFLILIISLMPFLLQAQDTIKNVIVMIPDGCSTALLSMSRWYAQYKNPEVTRLVVDDYLCGMVMTHSSDAPIGDSAPTSSCYFTGQPTQKYFVSTYPVKTDHDLYSIDRARAYQPMATLLEAARILKHKATGLVFRCEFPHATPADASAHTYNRNNYAAIAQQMVHNQIDVLIGGGNKHLNDDLASILKDNDYQIFRNDIDGMMDCHSGKFWALFNEGWMSYFLDPESKEEPTLAQMTQKALEILSQKPEGFFLMVEGSKIDWASHNNDAKAAIFEFLAFDEAVGIAMDFAKKEGHTVVLVLPDHGSGGFSIGNRKCNYGYDKLSLRQLMEPIDAFQISTSKMATLLKQSDASELPALVKQYYNIDLSEKEIDTLYHSSDYKNSPIPKEKRKGYSLERSLGEFLYHHSYFGSTTYGHTGDDVFMACYHPYNQQPHGVITNVEVNEFLCQCLGIEGQLPALTDSLFSSHQRLFADAQSIRIDSLGKDDYQLTVKYKKHQLVAHSYENFVTVDKEIIPLNSVIVYMKVNNTFYLPDNKHIINKLKSDKR